MNSGETLCEMVERVLRGGKFKIHVPAFSLELHYDSDFPPASPQTTSAGTRPAAASASVPASAPAAAGLRDYFQKKAPASYLTITGTPATFEEAGTGTKSRLIVTSDKGGKMTAWDRELWPLIRSRSGITTVFYVTQKDQYTNIVGVRA